MKIGFVGLGAMGSALACRLISEHTLLVYDLNAGAVQQFVQKGATAAPSLAQMARESDVVILCLPRSADVEKVIFAADGLAEGLAKGKLIIDQTSGIPGETNSFACRLAALGAEMLDAPVAGGVPSAIAGKITIMVSGSDHACERAKHVFHSVTPNLYRASNRVGDAQAVKMLNNMMNSCYRIVTLELVALACKLGLSLRAITNALSAGNAGNFSTRMLLPAIIERRSSADFALSLMVKDNNQAIDLGMQLDVAMPLSCLARGIMQASLNGFGADARLDDVVPFMETMTGVRYHDGEGTGADKTPETEEVAELFVDTLAACNRLIACENLAVGVKYGLSLEVMGEIINNASGWSRACESVVAELSGKAGKPERSLSQTVASLRRIEQLGASHGVPLLVTAQVRAICEGWLNEAGRGAPLDSMAQYYQRVSGVSFAR